MSHLALTLPTTSHLAVALLTTSLVQDFSVVTGSFWVSDVLDCSVVDPVMCGDVFAYIITIFSKVLLKIQDVPKKHIPTISTCYKNLLYRPAKNNFKMPSFTFGKMVNLPLSL